MSLKVVFMIDIISDWLLWVVAGISGGILSFCRHIQNRIRKHNERISKIENDLYPSPDNPLQERPFEQLLEVIKGLKCIETKIDKLSGEISRLDAKIEERTSCDDDE